MKEDNNERRAPAGKSQKKGSTRREFLAHMSATGFGFAVAPFLQKAIAAGSHVVEGGLPRGFEPVEAVPLAITINGSKHQLEIDARTTLLDLLREDLQLFGAKKGCDHGQCGACTVLQNGRRVNSCLTLAAACEGCDIVTIEGLGKEDALHPVQAAFVSHDAFQCGYCTPGQICSAIGLLREGHAHTDAEIRESISGNICRCGAYDNILSAIKEVQEHHIQNL